MARGQRSRATPSLYEGSRAQANETVGVEALAMQLRKRMAVVQMTVDMRVEKVRTGAIRVLLVAAAEILL